jgi:hypothetical protein
MNSQTSWRQSPTRGFRHSFAPSVARTSFRAEMLGLKQANEKQPPAMSVN